MSDVMERLQDQIDAMLVQLTEKDAEIERLRAERDHWQGLVSRADRALFPFKAGERK